MVMSNDVNWIVLYASKQFNIIRDRIVLLYLCYYAMYIIYKRIKFKYLHSQE